MTSASLLCGVWFHVGLRMRLQRNREIELLRYPFTRHLFHAINPGIVPFQVRYMRLIHRWMEEQESYLSPKYRECR